MGIERRSGRKLVVGLIRQCHNAKQLFQIHGFMLTSGLISNTLLLSTFIHVCSSDPFLLSHAYSAFTHYKTTSILVYNTMIKSLSLHSHFAKHSISLYTHLLHSSSSLLRPNSYSIPFLLKSVIRLSNLFLGRQIHSHAISTGLLSHVPVCTALIHMYSSFGCVSNDARKMFDEMCLRDVPSWNAMIAAYAKVGDVDNARSLFDEMPLTKNVFSWTTMIAGYTQAKRPRDAITIFRQMQLENVEPDEVTMLAALSACAGLGALQLGKWIHDYVTTYGIHATVSLNNALIDMYAKSGSIRKAMDVFISMKRKNVVTWSTMIGGLALHGLGRDALEMFSCMERDGTKPNDITFMALLSACSHTGLVETGRKYFKIMEPMYGIKPRIEHYGCVIDLLGRAGCLDEARELVKEMPFEANKAIWGSLLAASRIHGDVELGEQALQHLIQLEPNNSGNYTNLSNIYAAVGQWNEAGMTRKVMRDAGVKKMPGGSCIELNNRVHEFIAGQISHPIYGSRYDVVFQIDKQLKMTGDVNREYLGLLEFDEVVRLGM